MVDEIMFLWEDYYLSKSVFLLKFKRNIYATEIVWIIVEVNDDIFEI